MAVQITRYKVTCWLDRKTNFPMFGVKVRVVGQGWCDVAKDGKGCFFKTEADARREIARMKKQRDRAGWKIAKLAAA